MGRGGFPLLSERRTLGVHEPKVDEALAIRHGLKADEYARFISADRPDADFHRARHRFGDVERALLVQVFAPSPARPAD